LESILGKALGIPAADESWMKGKGIRQRGCIFPYIHQLVTQRIAKQ
jgi:hypothetical protein